MLIRWASPIALATAALAAQEQLAFLPKELIGTPQNDSATSATYTNEQLLEDTLGALQVMQEAYFEAWVGTWPKAIDWTAAVIGSHVAGALVSLSRSLKEIYKHRGFEEYLARENQISLYFSQLVAFYFGQNALSLRHQAYDDMLWVVLNWLDAIQFIDEHTKTHPLSAEAERQGLPDSERAIPESLRNQSWHGNLWTPAFAHRARIFWELASVGWDETLCGGGMIWNPRLGPYKNAITNELFIAASISMYKYFPGDNNASPFGGIHCTAAEQPACAQLSLDSSGREGWRPQDPVYLTAALKGYEWLMASNMTNKQGLFTDGFHISGHPGNGTKCDIRDEMVYTYNQGVVLTGLLELFRTTGRASFLRAGHNLIQSVIRATGWDLAKNKPRDDLRDLRPGRFPPWRGLGRAGILEEVCDSLGTCSQDSQTFKGIWMHHFTAFCSPLRVISSRVLSSGELEELRGQHYQACQKYLGFVRHNALAALRTRDAEGKFGMWWTPGLLSITLENLQLEPDSVPPMGAGVVDYRTYGIPDDPVWLGPYHHRQKHNHHQLPQQLAGVGSHDGGDRQQGVLPGPKPAQQQQQPLRLPNPKRDLLSDPNTRGRGRTVETQGGGVAVLRAFWELANQKISSP